MCLKKDFLLNLMSNLLAAVAMATTCAKSLPHTETLPPDLKNTLNQIANQQTESW